ncbi:MAG: tetratricopeptide repeat protein [Anaerolineaceae bacterium]|nr:tetratricopeptide repeat protein [Anaerolineaceae bacterium]
MLTIRLLGSLQLDINGEPVGSFRSSKALALFVYLAHTGQPQPREVLADLLWETGSTRQALSNLRTVLTQLRPKLGDYLLSDGATLAFNQAEAYWLDTAVLQTELSAVPQPLTPLSAARLETTLQNYRGDFLENFLVRNADRFNEWAIIEQERLRLRVLAAIQQLAFFFLEQQDFAAAIRAASRWLAIEPLEEAGHRSLMQAQALSGQRSAALQQYETCRELLAVELGLEPEETTQLLATQIEAGQFSAPLGKPQTAVSPSQTVAVPSAAQIPHNLQFTPFSFFGRLAEQGTVINHLQTPTSRLLTLTGVGGMGKTRLALVTAVQLLTNYAEKFPDGLFFLPLAALDSPNQLAATLAEVLKIPLKPEEDQPLLHQITAVLQTKKLLLILDNLEHLLEQGGRAFVQTLLENTADLKLLITSREPLDIAGESVLPLEGLTLPPETAVALNAPAAQLFQQAARRIQPAFSLTPADAPALRQLCRWLMGMPLALELAGAWADTLSLGDMVAEVEQNVDFLQALSTDRPGRQHSLRAVFNTTWQRLTPAEQALWPRLALFQNGFTFDAAQGALTASRPLLAQLVKKSLLQFDKSARRYSLHALLQQFGREMLSNEAAARDQLALARHYCIWLGRQLPNLHGGAQQETAAALIADWQNIRRAWFHACAAQQIDWLTAAAEPFNHFCLWRGNHLDALEALRAALEVTQPNATAAAQRLQALLLTWLALHHYEIGQLDQHQAALAAAAAVLEQPSLPPAEVRFERAFLRREQAKQWRKNDLDRAEAAYEESIRLFHELGETWQEVLSLVWLGDVVGRRHDWARMAQITQQMLALQEKLGDQRGMTFSLFRLAMQSVRQLKLKEAEKLVQQALEKSQALGDTELVAHALHSLGIVLLRGGRFVEAEAALQESLALTTEGSQDHVMLKDNLHMLGFHSLWQKNFARAEHFFRRALATGQQQQVVTTVADSLGFMGWNNLLAGRLADAQHDLLQAAQSGDKNRARNEQRWANPLGLAWLHLGDYQQAARWAAVAPTRIDAGSLQLGLLAVEERPLLERQSTLQQLVITFRQRGSRPNFPDLGETRGIAALTAAHVNLVEEGWLQACEVLQEALDTRQWLLLLYGLAAAARLQVHAEALADATRLLALVETFPLVQASRWFDAVLRQPVAAAIQLLPSAQRAALKATAQRQDPWQTAVALLQHLA